MVNWILLLSGKTLEDLLGHNDKAVLEGYRSPVVHHYNSRAQLCKAMSVKEFLTGRYHEDQTHCHQNHWMDPDPCFRCPLDNHACSKEIRTNRVKNGPQNTEHSFWRYFRLLDWEDCDDNNLNTHPLENWDCHCSHPQTWLWWSPLRQKNAFTGWMLCYRRGHIPRLWPTLADFGSTAAGSIVNAADSER